MIPGPVEMDAAVLQEAGKLSYSHVDPYFIETFGVCLENLKEVFAAPDGFPFVVAGSGTLAMELAVANLIEPGDRAVMTESGFFSWRMQEILERHGAEVELVKAAVGDCPTLDAVEEALKKGAKVLAITHVDTSTGVVTPVKEYAALARKYHALSIVDGVCAVAGQEFRQQEWDVDVCLTGSQKAFAVPTGLALLMVRPRAMQAFKARTKPVASYYADWGKWIPVMEAYLSRSGAYFGTPAVNLVFALAEGVRQILAEGMEARWARHKKLSYAFKSGAKALGLEILPVSDEKAAVTMSTLYYPEGKDASGLKKVSQAGVTLAGGLHPAVKDRYFRVGHMGNNGIAELLTTLAAIETGFDLEAGKGVAAAQKAWQEG